MEPLEHGVHGRLGIHLPRLEPGREEVEDDPPFSMWGRNRCEPSIVEEVPQDRGLLVGGTEILGLDTRTHPADGAGRVGEGIGDHDVSTAGGLDNAAVGQLAERPLHGRGVQSRRLADLVDPAAADGDRPEDREPPTLGQKTEEGAWVPGTGHGGTR